MTQQLTSSSRKRLLDEASFQELLAAAYVLQRHNELSGDSYSNSTEVLSEIVRLKRLIRSGQANLLATAKLISEQAQRFTHASGVAIGIVVDSELTYLAAIGNAAHEMGLRTPLNLSLSANCLRTGLTQQSLSTKHDSRILPAVRNRADVRSFIAVPVNFENRVVGALEARFINPNAFQDDDVHTCELMAALVKEVIARAGKPKFASEMELSNPELSKPELCKPELNAPELKEIALPEAALSPVAEILPQRAGDVEIQDEIPVQNESLQVQNVDPVPAPTMLSAEPRPLVRARALIKTKEVHAPQQDEPDVLLPPSAPAGECRGCGQDLTADELFCGKCGTERASSPEDPLQKKWARLWYMKQARKGAEPDDEAPAVQELYQEELYEPEPHEEAAPKDSLKTVALQLDHASVTENIEEETAIAAPEQVMSATTAPEPSVRLEWLPVIAPSETWLRRRWLHHPWLHHEWLGHQWRVNRANFYLAGAALLLIVVLFVGGTTQVQDSHLQANRPQLTFFENVLVSLGLAEAPATPVYLGNPDTPVWVDMHTALYYCPGSDLYGRTDGGKIATQRSAQLDQFEPAHRRACN